MILEKLILRNWRGYRDPHTFRFENGFNLITGRNEAGKSTLFEAMTRVLFDRHNSRTEEIRQIQPLGSTLSPEAELTFCDNGDRYRVRKRFLEGSVAELYKERGGTWELDHEGDRADQELRSMLQGETFKRATRPEHRGLAQALWYLQREQPLPRETWAESIKQGLAGLVQDVVESTDDAGIYQAIDAGYGADFTPTGRVRSASELTKLEVEIREEEQQLENLRSRSEHVEELRSNLEELTERSSHGELRLKQARTDLEQLVQALESADALEKHIQHNEKAVQSAEEGLQKISDDQSNIERRAKEIEERTSGLENALRESDQFEADARQERLAAEVHHKNWKEKHELKLHDIEIDERILQALERLRGLTQDKERLQSHLSRVRAGREDLHAGKQDLADLHAPSEQEFSEFQKSLIDLHMVEGQVETSAIRVTFELEDATAVAEAEPEVERAPGSDEFLVMAPTAFKIQGVGVIRVRGGGSSIEELNTKATVLRSKVDNTLHTYDAEDPQGLSNLYQQRKDLENAVERHQDRLDVLTGEEPEGDPEEELTRVLVGIREESGVSDVATEEWKTWGGQKLREKNTTLDNEKNLLIELIKEQQSHEKKANDAQLEARKNAQEASNAVAGLRSSIRGLERENTEVLKTYGTMEHLKEALTQSTDQLQKAQGDLDSLMKDYTARVERPRLLHEQGVESVRKLEQQRGNIANEIVDRKARIEEAAAQGLYSQTADVEGALQAKRRRFETVRRRSEAIKLLHEMVVAYKTQQSAALAVPVAALVNKWLLLLTDDAYDELDLSEELLPLGVHYSRYDESLPLESLSYGTYEQVIVLVRLALGVLLSADERNLVIIDDRLVNADSVRMKRLCLILEEVASKNCQVVVATCDDTRYSGITGHTIRVPLDGKPSLI